MLFRTSHHSGPLEIELTRRNIPFVKYGGLKFLDAAHVKDMLALLRWAENPRDRVAGFRVLQLLPGIGPGTAGKLLDAIDAAAAPASLALAELPAPAARRRLGRASSTVVADLAASPRLARRLQPRPRLVRAAARGGARGRRGAPARSAAARADRLRLSQPRALPHRADARSARRHLRPVGPPASRTRTT